MKRVHRLLIGLAVAGVLFALSRTRKGQVIIEEIADDTGAEVEKIKDLIFDEEGLRLTAYQDPGAGRAWTIGYGHKILSTDGLYPYTNKTAITQAEADEFFRRDTEIATHAVDDAVNVLLTTNQRAALISLVYNIGVTAWRNSTILKKINARDFPAAANEFSRWIYDNGVVSQILVGRRERERSLFLA